MNELLVGPTGGDVVADSPERRLEVLAEHDTLHATWSRFGPRREGADLHVHRSHADVFYVLEGELTIRLGARDELVRAPAGTFALVPRMVIHGFRNGTDADVRYLNLHAPGMGFADYLRALRAGRRCPFDQEPPPHEGTRPESDAVIAGPGDRAGAVTLADIEEIGVREVSVGAGEPPAPAHVHHQHVESFYVLEGSLAVAVDGRELDATAGSWVHVPPRVGHAVSFPEAARFLEVHTPSFGLGAGDQQPA